MDEEEKRLLIKIYSENPILWKSGDPDHNNKIQRAAVKELLLSTFNNKYNIEALEKAFRSLRTCMSREIKKENEGNASKKKWKFYDQFEFLRDELNLATSLKKEVLKWQT